MEESVLLVNMTILLLLGGICSMVFRKLKMPAVIGYLVTGIILANYWSGKSEDTELIVNFLSDLGLIFLMFCIGMELNLKKLRKMGSFAIMVVMIQVPLMLFGGYLLGMLFLGLDSLQAIIFGAIISGSSTAVVTIVLKDQDRLTHAEVETVILITVVEDVAQVIILSAISPMMTGEAMSAESIVWMLLTIIVFMVAAIGLGLLFIPKLLDWIGEKMSDEIILIVALGLCFCMAWLSTLVGLSMAIGAFMMGVIVSQAKPAKIIEHDIRPMKDIFMMMFFISIGLEIRPESLVDNIAIILIIYMIYFVLKCSSVLLAYFVGNKPMRMSFYSSISLVAMGEFAFIISKEAYDANIISPDFYAAVVGSALMTMILLPIIDSKSEKICDTVQNKSPQFMVNGFLKLEKMRSNFYAKLSLASKTTRANFRTRVTYTYFEVMLLAIVEICVYIMTPFLAEFLYDNTSEAITTYYSTMIIMIANFVVLIPIIYRLVFNFKFIERVMLDSERKAAEAGSGNIQSRTAKIMKYLVEMNAWILIIAIDFLIILIMPNEVSLLDHFVVAGAGTLFVAIAYTLRYLKRR
ncbi:cation:proton antiporter [Methanomethylophilus alvi]|uniref:cation:proton antiporter n=1 Tax=Methanomethylophilus alvi TaxID=1291540 RepID=UPI0037DC6B6C